MWNCCLKAVTRKQKPAHLGGLKPFHLLFQILNKTQGLSRRRHNHAQDKNPLTGSSLVLCSFSPLLSTLHFHTRDLKSNRF